MRPGSRRREPALAAAQLLRRICSIAGWISYNPGASRNTTSWRRQRVRAVLRTGMISGVVSPLDERGSFPKSAGPTQVRGPDDVAGVSRRRSGEDRGASSSGGCGHLPRPRPRVAWRQRGAHSPSGTDEGDDAIERCRTAALGGHVARCGTERAGTPSSATTAAEPALS